jgi:hypothetical protein
MSDAFSALDAYVSGLEQEAAADPKAFYGNKAVPATGHERIADTLRSVNAIRTRLQNIDRGR